MLKTIKVRDKQKCKTVTQNLALGVRNLTSLCIVYGHYAKYQERDKSARQHSSKVLFFIKLLLSTSTMNNEQDKIGQRRRLNINVVDRGENKRS